MVVTVNEKKPLSFGVKAAVSIIVVSLLLGVLLKIFNKPVELEAQDNSVSDYVSSSLVIPEIRLKVKEGSPEKEWTEALANFLGGKSEVKIENGRVDVLTESYAIEVDALKKWQEGLGQAIHYGMATNKISVLAIIYEQENSESKRLLKKVEKITTSKGVKLIVLRAELSEHS